MEKAETMAKRHCYITMISAAVVLICVCVGVTMNLTTLYDENFDHMGLMTFCMFTVNSNILCALAMAFVLPYSLDGIRKHNFYVPKWVMVVAFTGVTAVALTFIISLFVLAPFKGFYLIFSGSRFFLHGVCPIVAIIAFCFFMSEQRLSFASTFIAMIPVFIYACVYFVMVVIIGEEHGGWSDFYGFVTHLPLWVPLTVIMPLTFLIATVIRALHNRTFNLRRMEEAEYFAKVFKDIDMKHAISLMASMHKKNARGKDIYIPGRVIGIMLDNNEGTMSWDDCCKLYLKEYLQIDEVMDIQKIWV